jgi:hypothetical protein
MNPMIPPTPGRIVWFYPSTNVGSSGFASPAEGQPLAAIVARVWSDSCVNLTVFDANGVPHSRTSVVLVQDGSPKPAGGHYAEWMPYQKGQAAKAGAAERVEPTGVTAYRKKPVVIEAFQMTSKRREDNGDWPNWLNRAWNEERGAEGSLYPTVLLAANSDRTLSIGTLEGPQLVSWNDWIIRGVKGEIYPCKPDVFALTYEAVGA